MKQVCESVARVGVARVLHRAGRQRGFSLTETTIMLATMTVLTATAAPSIMDYVSQARTIKASGDVQVLTTTLARLLFDVSHLKSAATGQTPKLLVGPGDTVEPAVAGSAEWAAALDGTNVQLMDEHLVTNEAGYPRREGVGFSKGWGGPYLEAVPIDPWGHRYAANIGVFGTGDPVIVLSAGANGKVETPFRLNVFKPGGDDIIGLLGSQR
ncbi:MAG: type II secretion system protein GspG [Acidobacteriota bacterium]